MSSQSLKTGWLGSNEVSPQSANSGGSLRSTPATLGLWEANPFAVSAIGIASHNYPSETRALAKVNGKG
jgi:hypothetical protein